ncbi:MAG: hypothetical protein ACRCX8_21225 [Sarcina sp.]
MKTELDFESRNTTNGASREMIITPKSKVLSESLLETFARYGYTGNEETLVKAILKLVENVDTIVPPAPVSK